MSDLPKLAYLSGEYPRASDTFIQREVAALRALGHEVLTCSIRRTGTEHLVGPEQCAEAARTFHVLKATASPARLIAAHLRWMRRPAAYLSALRLAWRTAPRGLRGRAYNLIYFLEAAVLAAQLADAQVDHLHNHIAKASCTVAMLASALSGIPYSFTIHGPDIFFEPQHWRIDEKAARASFVACISHFCRAQLMCFAERQHWNRFHIVHCGADPDRYGTEDRDGTRLLFVGRLAAVKGLPVLLEALASVPGARLTVIGDGPERAEIEAQAKGLNVTFAGYQSQSVVADTLRGTDIFVLPSFAEGVPVVLMEAMAAQVPVVATQIAGIPELVADGVSGRLVPPGDAEALARALRELLADPELRARMGAAGRARVTEAFDIHKEARRLSQLFQSYANKAPTPPVRAKEVP